MDANTLSIAESLSQLQLSVDRNLTSLCRNDVIVAEARLRVILQEMRGYLNAFSPINRLPPEMLVAIFREATKYCVQLPVLDGFGGRKMVQIKPLFRLIHVCRTWRSVAIGDASFWSHIDVTHQEELLDFLLQCSSESPLTLYASSVDPGSVDRILTEHGARVRAVYFSQCFRAISHLMDKTLSSIFERFCLSAPQLECFTLGEHSRGSWTVRQAHPQVSDSSPVKALALVLPDAFFPTNFFPNLTHLYLAFPSKTFQNFAGSLLRMLSRAPRLQILQLSDLHIRGELWPEPFEHPHPHVSLDQLRLLVIRERHMEVAFYLLKYFTLPESVLLSIEGSEDSDDRLSLRLPHIAPLNVVTFMEISLEFSGLLLTGYNTQFTSGFLIRTSGNCNFWRASWLPELHTMMPLSMITVLHIDNGGTVLPPLLPHFVQLEQLSILLSQLESIHGTATVAQTAGALFASLTPVTTLVCPALRFLGLKANITHDAFPYAELKAMAAARHERGHPISRFVYRVNGRPRWWSPGTPESQEKDKVDALQAEASLSAFLGPYVDSVEYRLSSSEKLCPFILRECWHVPDVEKYWMLPDGVLWNYDPMEDID